MVLQSRQNTFEALHRTTRLPAPAAGDESVEQAINWCSEAMPRFQTVRCNGVGERQQLSFECPALHICVLNILRFMSRPLPKRESRCLWWRGG
eukprot:4889269-Prymnesium_polylepis.1